jgi:hypothetical protein
MYIMHSSKNLETLAHREVKMQVDPTYIRLHVHSNDSRMANLYSQFWTDLEKTTINQQQP